MQKINVKQAEQDLKAIPDNDAYFAADISHKYGLSIADLTAYVTREKEKKAARK